MSGEKNTNVPVRDLSVKQGFKLSKFLVSWEMVLIYILLLINVVLMVSRTNLYFSPGTIQAIIQSGMDVCPLVLGMILILMLGDIDVSVASTMIFASMATGLCCQAGMPAFVGVIVGIAAGALCGLFNGYFVAYVEMPAVIVTIATSMLFRGIVKIILDVDVVQRNRKDHPGRQCVETVPELLHNRSLDQYRRNPIVTDPVPCDGSGLRIPASEIQIRTEALHYRKQRDMRTVFRYRCKEDKTDRFRPDGRNVRSCFDLLRRKNGRKRIFYNGYRI